jgi:3-keto-disaccharide hydrolase
MRTSVLAALPVVLLISSSTALPQSDPGSSAAWRTLFDGKSLDGWEHIGPGKMDLVDGVIRTEGGMGLLWYTKEKFGDCVIRVVYKTSSKHSNSGVYVRIADKPKDVWFPVHHGYEVQIEDAGDEYHGTGAIYSLSKSIARPVKPHGEWNTMEITLRGQQILVSLNGGQVNDFDSEKASVPDRVKDYEPERGPRPASGYIGLQNHDDVSGSSPVYFKEVRVRPLTKHDVPKR